LTIEELYNDRVNSIHNMAIFLPKLRSYAEKVDKVTEFGVDVGYSTTAFLAARPEYGVESYDIERNPWVVLLQSIARVEGIPFRFNRCNTLKAEPIKKTGLLLIDSEHSYRQVAGELSRHAEMVTRYIAFHDIVSCPQILPAIDNFLKDHPQGSVVDWDEREAGLAVLELTG
jgi:hypothetical protein